MPGRPRSSSTTSGGVAGGQSQRFLAVTRRRRRRSRGPARFTARARRICGSSSTTRTRVTPAGTVDRRAAGGATPRRGDGEVDDDREAAAGRVVELDAAADGLDEAAGDGEAEADAGLRAAVAEPLERLEHAARGRRGRRRDRGR